MRPDIWLVAHGNCSVLAASPRDSCQNDSLDAIFSILESPLHAGIMRNDTYDTGVLVHAEIHDAVMERYQTLFT